MRCPRPGPGAARPDWCLPAEKGGTGTTGSTPGAWGRVDLLIGGEYRWTVTPDHDVGGTFQEIEPVKRVVFTWGRESGMDLAPGSSTGTITLEPDAEGTSLRLVHD